MGELVPVPVKPPGELVTVYPVMGDPPLEAGAVKLTVAEALPAVAVTPVGEPGRIAVTVRVMVPLVKLAWVRVLESVPETVKV
jgi:hypothetical protein